MVAGALVTAVASVVPAQAFSAKHHSKKDSYKKYHAYGSYKGHRHDAGVRYYPWHAHAYGPRFGYGYRPDCYQFKQRAVLTLNPYWRYAYSSCIHDYYRKSY